MLLELDGPGFVLTLDGPLSPAFGLVGHGPPMGTLRIDGSATSARYFRADGQSADWDGTEGPALFEDTTYQLTLRWKDGAAGRGSLTHRDPSVLRNVVPVPGFDGLHGPINFRRDVGRTRFLVAADKAVTTIELTVFPAKIDFESDYLDLVHEIEDAERALALEYFGATAISARRVAGVPSSVEWLTLLRAEADDLERSLSIIASRPRRQLVATERLIPIERHRRPTPATLRGLARGRGGGGWHALGGLPVRRNAWGLVREESLDTPEHRWLRGRLREVVLRLGSIGRGLERRADVLASRSRTTRRVEAQLAEVVQMRGRLGRFLEESPLVEASDVPHIGAPSLALLASPGYGSAYRSLQALRSALDLGGDDVDVTLKSVDALYEYWCFLRVVMLLAALTGGQVDVSGLVATTDQGVGARLIRGRSARVRILAPDREIRVSYNHEYSGLTGTQKPDIVLEFRCDGWPPMVLVLDAKYRLDSSVDYIAAFGAPGPPIDAVNQLHRYRDAVTVAVGASGLGRPVVRGAALFPLDPATASAFGEQRLALALTELGIGAIPFVPSYEDGVRDWLTQLLSEPPAALAVAGPPFLAEAHANATAATA